MDPQNPEAILQRLEELRHWQAEQQTALQAKQIAQRDLLNMEQQKLYEMFGLSMSGDGSSVAADETPGAGISFDESRQQLMRNLCEMTESDEQQQQQVAGSSAPVLHASDVHDSAYEPSVEPRETLENPQSDKYIEHNAETTTKRTFLRRGQGLQNRFGMHPDALRINNLPKYKFSGAHRQSRFFRNATQKLVVKPLSSEPTQPWIGADDVVEPLNAVPALAANRMSSAKPPPPARIDHQRVPTALQPPMRPRSNLSVQDTPIRDRIRQQQAEIDELDDFEQLETNLQYTLTVGGHPPAVAAVPDSPPLQRLSTDSDDGSDDDVQCGQPRVGVRFHSQVLVNQAPQFGSASDTDTCASSTDIDGTDTTVTEKTSTPNVNEFRAFKAQLFRAHHCADESTITDVDAKPDDAGHNVVRTSVPVRQPPQQAPVHVSPANTNPALVHTQLEQEIALFRTQNARLTAAAQQLQLDRVALAAERCAHEERCADDRARAEIQLHDERIKLVAEREALDRRARDLRGPNRREREETAALRERVEQLEREAAAKDQRHVAAQARLRAQLRTMEKDLKEYTFEMEQLRKEGKRLEAENARLRRESNSKMLNEINRNIARLGERVVGANGGDQQQQPAAGKVKAAPKVVAHPAAVAPRARTRSVPNLAVLQPDPSSTLSSDDDDEEDAATAVGAEQTHYFQPDTATRRSRSRSHENKENIETQTESQPMPVASAAPSKREIVNADGSKDILYANGNLKKVSADSMRVRMLYFNKDIKETNVGEGTVKYYYAETNTWQTSYLDGLEILEFPK